MLRTGDPRQVRWRVALPAIGAELAATVALSWPLVVGNIAQSAMTATDVLMLGRLSPEALAAGALGYNLFLPLLLFGIGLVGAVAPIAASQIGADPHDLEGPRRAAHQAFFSAILLAIPMEIFLWNAKGVFLAFGQAPDLASEAANYLRGLHWAMGPALLFFAGRSMFSALSRVGATLVAAVLAAGVNACGNYALIFGHFGLPALGVYGSGLATALSQVFMLGVLIVAGIIDPKIARYGLTRGPWRFDRADFLRLWRLGAPIGATITVEIVVFSGAVFFMGLLGSASLEGHAIVFQIISLAFMVPLGISQAATVRVGRAYGARDAAGASRAGWVALAIGAGFAIASAATMLLFADALLGGFIDASAREAPAILERAKAFLRVAALFQIFDSAQAVAGGMLRGAHDARVPMAMALFGYWGVGLPVGLALAFLTPLAGTGLWIGLATGLACVSALLLMRWISRERAGFFVASAP